MKRRSDWSRWSVVATMCLMMAATGLQAGTTVWTGASGVDTDWSNAANWSGAEPLAFDRAVIRVNSDLSPVVSKAGENCYTMDIGWGMVCQGLLTIESGDLTVNSAGIALEVGGYGDGTIVQTDGTLTVKGYMTMGGLTSTLPLSGSGTYNMSGGSISVTREFTVGCKGTGNFTQSDGTINVSEGTFIGRGNTGSYTMSGGTLNLGTSFTDPAAGLWVSYGGPGGTFTQTGGTVNSNGKVVVGQGAPATYSLTGGSLNLTGNNNLVIGGTGPGTFLLGDANTTGYIGNNDENGSTNLYVGETATSIGQFKGWGEVDVRFIYNNGKVISDGYGTERLLDLSDGERVFNAANAATSGWYAVNRGGVVLPSVRFNTVAGQATHTWGGNIYDFSPTLVNSVSITLANDCKGNIDGALLAADRTDLPAFSDPNAKIIGIWDIAIGLDPDSVSTDLSNSTIVIRYDDALAASLGLEESALVIYQYVDGQWTALTSTVNTADKTISANTDSFSLFAVGVVASSQLLPGDANSDGMVDVGDLGILAANYGTATGATWAQGDFNSDGAVDVGDLGILAANYGTGTSGADWDADYAKAFGTTVAEEDSADETSSTLCSGLGLPLIAGLALMGLMLVKLED